VKLFCSAAASASFAVKLWRIAGLTGNGPLVTQFSPEAGSDQGNVLSSNPKAIYRWQLTHRCHETAFLLKFPRDWGTHERGIGARHRAFTEAGDTHTLREPDSPYIPLFFRAKTGPLKPESRSF
jgi:hypothetical protein